MPGRELLELLVMFAAAAGVLVANRWLGPAAAPTLLALTVLIALGKTAYYFWETLWHLVRAAACNLAYHRFLLLIAYNMGQITVSFALDYYLLQRIDPQSLSGIDPSLSGVPLMFDCFYFSVLNCSFFGYGDIIPAHIPAKMVLLLQVVTAFATVIFLLSDFASIKESMR